MIIHSRSSSGTSTGTGPPVPVEVHRNHMDTAINDAAVYPRDEVWNALREVEDPELAISLVDLGLVVGVCREGSRVAVEVTYTMMGCPAMDMIQDDIRARLLAIDDIETVDIEVVWEPVWTKARLTSEGREALLLCGVSI
jgi:metal-sulfur cluster biosynthetic enzyme